MSQGPDQQQEDLEVVRFYTSTRRFPKLIGKLPTGEVIPGGPYTVAQFVWALAVAFMLMRTKGIWGTGNGFMNIGIIVGGAVGAAYIAGRMPATARNPLALIAYIPEAWGAPTGRYRGKVVKLPAVEQVTSVALIDVVGGLDETVPTSVQPPEPDVESASSSPALTEADKPATESAPVPAPLSAVQSLLASASRSN